MTDMVNNAAVRIRFLVFVWKTPAFSMVFLLVNTMRVRISKMPDTYAMLSIAGNPIKPSTAKPASAENPGVENLIMDEYISMALAKDSARNSTHSAETITKVAAILIQFGIFSSKDPRIRSITTKNP